MNKILISGFTMLLLIPFTSLVHASDSVNSGIQNDGTPCVRLMTQAEKDANPHRTQDGISGVMVGDKCITGNYTSNVSQPEDTVKIITTKSNDFFSQFIALFTNLFTNLQTTIMKNPSNTQTPQEQSPYGPKQTAYLMEQYRKIPKFMDCTDDQIIHYFNIEKEFDKISYVNTYRTDSNGIPITNTPQEQAQYNTLYNQVLNYHC